MAEVGNNPTTPGTAYSFTLNSHAAGISITMPEDGTSGSIWLFCDTTSTVGVRAAIYEGPDTSDALVDSESSEVSPGATTESWLEIPLSGVSLLNGATYFLAVSSDETGGVELYGDFSQANTGYANYYEDGEPWVDPIGANAYDDGTEQGFFIYLEYTASGGGDPEGRLVGGKLLRGGMLIRGRLI